MILVCIKAFEGAGEKLRLVMAFKAIERLPHFPGQLF